jgi:hypothetical protein
MKNQCLLLCLGTLLVLSFVALPAAAQVREIPLPFPDTTRFRVQFVDEMNGWVSSMNGTILHTSDGGVNWDVYRTPYPKPVITEIRFSSKDYGVLWANVGHTYNGLLYQTFNAGKDWQQVPTYDSISIFYSWRYDVYPMSPGYIIWSGMRSWRIGTSSKYELITAWTTNGGLEWNKSVYPFSYPDVFVPLDTNRWGWFDGAMEIPDMTPISAFAVSTDHGLTWHEKRTWIPMVSSLCEFQDAKRGIVFGRRWIDGQYDPGSYVTYDGGETWERWEYFSQQYSAVFVGDSVLYCVTGACRSRSWDPRPCGPLIRCPRQDPFLNKRYIIDTGPGVTAISPGGALVYALLVDGRLVAVDDRLVGIEDIPETPDAPPFEVSPNPARREITIRRSGRSLASDTFELYDTAGKRVLSDVTITLQQTESQRTLSVAALPAGTYFIVGRGERVQIQQFTVAR